MTYLINFMCILFGLKLQNIDGPSSPRVKEVGLDLRHVIGEDHEYLNQPNT